MKTRVLLELTDKDGNIRALYVSIKYDSHDTFSSELGIALERLKTCFIEDSERLIHTYGPTDGVRYQRPCR